MWNSHFRFSYEVSAFVIVLAISSIFFSVQTSLAAKDEKTAFPRDAQLKTGDLYALVVGLSKYKHSGIPKLDLSDKDANSFGDFLKAQNEVFKDTKVTFLLNDKATKLEIEKYLYYTLPKTGKDDTVILFFSGHGAFDPIRPNDFLFLPYDAEPDFLGTTAVKMTGLDFLKGVSADRVLIIADACYAGGFTEMKAKALAPSLDSFLREVRNSSGRAVITSTKPEQLSWEAPGLKNSVFTHNLLEGLRGKADKDQDGLITLNEAYEYAYSMTKDQTKGHQHPQFEGKVVGAFPLSFVGSKVPQSELKRIVLKSALSGNLVEFEKASSRFANLDIRNEDNSTPLMLASAAGKTPIVKFLTTKKADVEAVDNKRNTALCLAAENGREDVVKILLDAGAAINVKNSEGKSPLALAAENGHVKVVDILMEKGADPKSRTLEGHTPLVLAAENGRTEVVSRIMSHAKGLKDEELNASGALLRAIETGNPEVVKIIPGPIPMKLRNGSHLEQELFTSTLRSDSRKVAQLLERGADPTVRTESGDTCLVLASGLGYDKIVSQLLVKDRDRSDLNSALMRAAANGKVNSVVMLIEKGADPNYRDEHQTTALIRASERGHLEVASALIQRKADINATDEKGLTPLMVSTMMGNENIVKLLLRNGADTERRDKEGDSALIIACARGYLEISKLLMNSEAINVNATNNQKTTPLIAAARNGHSAIVKLLIANGADISSSDWEGKTALTSALERDHKDTAELLSK